MTESPAALQREKGQQDEAAGKLCSPLQERTSNHQPPQSAYLKKLLEENFNLKQELEKQKKFPTGKTVQISEPELADKENQAGAGRGGRAGSVAGRGKPSQPVRAAASIQSSSRRARTPVEGAGQQIGDHAHCLQHQVCQLKEELERRANQPDCTCRQGAGRGAGQRAGQSCPQCRGQLCRQGPGHTVRFEEKLDPQQVSCTYDALQGNCTELNRRCTCVSTWHVCSGRFATCNTSWPEPAPSQPPPLTGSSRPLRLRQPDWRRSAMRC